MKLPSPDVLATDAQRRLYQHDLLEFHSTDERSRARLLYMSRFDACVEAVRRFAPPGIVADIGCAQGNLGLYLAEHGYRVVSIDLRPTFLEYLRGKKETGTIWAVAGNACQLPVRPPVAAAVLLEVVEHVAFPEAAMHEVAQILAPGGIVCLTTPNGERFRTGLPTFSAVADRAELAHRQFEPDADGHLFYFTRAELTALVRESGFDVLEHRFYGTPWLTGRLMGRYITRYFRSSALQLLDRFTLRSDVLARRLAEGHLLVARRRPS